MEYDLDSILQLVKRRTGMYLINDSIYAIGQFITGVETANRMYFGFDEAHEISFMEWIEHKYKISSPAWNWTRILHHVSGSEQAALALFFEIWPEYVEQRSSYPIGQSREGYGCPTESITDSFWAFLNSQQWPV